MAPSRLLCCVLALAFTSVTAIEKSWSDHTYLGVSHDLLCNDSTSFMFINLDDKIEWTKLGHPDSIVTDEHYEVMTEDGISGMKLHIREVTEEMTGIYFCNVQDKDNNPVGRVVRGLNVGGRRYDDLIDKYETNVIVGIIAAASVFVLIVGVCLIDRFRYLTDEQKQKKREREENRLRRKRELQNGGYENQAMDNDVVDERDGKRSYSPQDTRL